MDARRDSHRLAVGECGERAGRSRECRNRWGALKQARGPRRSSRGLVAARYVTCRPARRFLADRRRGQAGGFLEQAGPLGQAWRNPDIWDPTYAFA